MTAVQIRTPTDQNGNGLPVARLDTSRAVQVAVTSNIETIALEPGVWLLISSVNAFFAQRPLDAPAGPLLPLGMMSQFWLAVGDGDIVELAAIDDLDEGFAVFTPAWSA